METERCCGNCKYHEYEEIDQGYVCVNDQSDYIADWTDYGFCCEDWEEKDDGA